ncbi:MAG: hypothetical protein ACRC51_01915 [Cetobacterium sp.]
MKKFLALIMLIVLTTTSFARYHRPVHPVIRHEIAKAHIRHEIRQEVRKDIRREIRREKRKREAIGAAVVGAVVVGGIIANNNNNNNHYRPIPTPYNGY